MLLLPEIDKDHVIRKIHYGSYLEEGNGCWLWKRCKIGKYGVMRLSGRNHYVHGVSFSVFKGEVPEFDKYDPEALCVLHKCDVPHCCNPEHLFLGTRSQNIADRDAKGRQSKGPSHKAFKGQRHTEESKQRISASVIKSRENKFWSSRRK